MPADLLHDAAPFASPMNASADDLSGDRVSGDRVADVGVTPSLAPTAELFRAHFDFIWRSLRRLGLDAGHADDAAQEVFIVASRKQGQIEAGRERAFLFGTALRVASDMRKSIARRREAGSDDAELSVDPVPGPDALLEQRRAREVLDLVLDELPDDVRAVFVLYELEELEMQEIATLLSIHQGTVASRLRRGRALFAAAVRRRQARPLARGGVR